MSPSLSDVPTSPRNATAPIALICTQGFLGLVLGGATAMVLLDADPFSVESFPIPQGADGAQAMADFDRLSDVVSSGLHGHYIPQPLCRVPPIAAERRNDARRSPRFGDRVKLKPDRPQDETASAWQGGLVGPKLQRIMPVVLVPTPTLSSLSCRR
jgi:hypothetical protein